MADYDVAGLKLLVVGAASGIGAAVAQLGTDQGAQVVGADLRLDGHATLQVDLREPDQIDQVVSDAVAQLDGLDALIITAGIGRYAAISQSDAEVWQQHVSVNLVAPALLVRAALPWLRASDYASVTTFASAAGLRSYPEFGAYSASKAGLVRWTKVAAWELAGDGIRVNCVSPGPIDTPLLRLTQPSSVSGEDWLRQVATHTAMLRAGTPAEVAGATLFLTGRSASYITGAVLPLDGGEIA